MNPGPIELPSLVKILCIIVIITNKNRKCIANASALGLKGSARQAVGVVKTA